ncbi:MAG: transglutaminase domain-containing protein [Candidatus Sifarchaeia archaeon]
MLGSERTRIAVVILIALGISMPTTGMMWLNNNALTVETQDLQAQLSEALELYDGLSSQYEDLLSNYSMLMNTLSILSDEHYSLNDTYCELTENFQILQADYDSLNETYYILVQDFENLQTNYTSLQAQYIYLQSLYSSLTDAYDQLMSDYVNLQIDYNTLFDAFTLLQAQYNTLSTWISQMTLPAQYQVFAEAVRRYYLNSYILGDTYRGFTRFCRDVVLHDSQIGPTLEGSWFPDVSNAFSDMLFYGNETEHLAFDIFYWVFYPWIPNWGWRPNPGDPTTDITNIVQWCVDNIDYEFDSDITHNQNSSLWDYPKFPVETAFRTMGDCEDQAMLCAAYLESCGFETMMVIIHDSEWNSGSGLYHGVPMVWWDNTWGVRPAGTWGFGFAGDGVKYDDGWWMFLDTTWDTPFGSDPAWLQWYVDTDINQVFDNSKFSYAVCDYNGWTSPLP